MLLGVLLSLILKTTQGKRLPDTSRQPASLLSCPHDEKDSPHVQSEPFFQFTVFPLILSPGTTVKTLGLSPQYSAFRH